MLGMAGWNVHVDGRLLDIVRSPLDHYWLCVDYAWPRCIANIDLAVQARLSDTDRYADISGHRRCSQDKQACRQNDCFHDFYLFSW
jgi:hypothetical protein